TITVYGRDLAESSQAWLKKSLRFGYASTVSLLAESFQYSPQQLLSSYVSLPPRSPSAAKKENYSSDYLLPHWTSPEDCNLLSSHSPPD
ncbi:hypothetical protein ILYODFUR_031417, partial [Ilyodon furcidens]